MGDTALHKEFIEVRRVRHSNALLLPPSSSIPAGWPRSQIGRHLRATHRRVRQPSQRRAALAQRAHGESMRRTAKAPPAHLARREMMSAHVST